MLIDVLALAAVTAISAVAAQRRRASEQRVIEAEAMGGTLTVTSREGLGATFTATFEECGTPLAALEGVPSMRRASPSAPGRFDLVLLDQNLPDVHGLEVLRQLRSRENRSDVRVVILSADAAPGKVAGAMNAGATDYLVKPSPSRVCWPCSTSTAALTPDGAAPATAAAAG